MEQFRHIMEIIGTGMDGVGVFIVAGGALVATWRLARWVVLLHVAPEIIEDTNEVAIKIGGHKLAQLPRFVLGLGNDLRVRGLPLCEEFVDLSLAVEIEPEKDRAYVAVGLAEGAIGDKQSAIPPGDACNASLVVPPIEGEAERVDIVGCGFVDVRRRNLRDRSRERHGVVGLIVARARGLPRRVVRRAQKARVSVT